MDSTVSQDRLHAHSSAHFQVGLKTSAFDFLLFCLIDNQGFLDAGLTAGLEKPVHV